MKIGFDAKRAFHNSTGLGNYSRTLIRSLVKFFPDQDYHLYSPSFPDLGYFTDAGSYKNISIHHPKGFINTTFPSLWRSKGIVNDLLNDKIEIYHGLSNELPIGIEKTKIKTVVTIHDVIFKRYPQFYPSVDRKIYDRKWKHALEIADSIVCISEQTKQDVIEYYPGIYGDEKKLQVIYQSFERPALNDTSIKPTTDKKFILAVGRMEERKNLNIVLESMAFMKATDRPQLIVVGKKTSYFKWIEEFILQAQLENFVSFPGEVSNEELNQYYRSASALVFPSLFEGFGLPILEAQAAGTPVICSDIPVLKEVAGENAIFADPLDPNDWQDKILDVLRYSESQRAMVANNGIENCKRFSPEKISEQWNQHYQSLLK